MSGNKFEVQRMRVASPCAVSWESMKGDSRVRRCGSCDLNVYNTSDMTAKEIEMLIRSSEGRLCIMLHRRADGTILTNDCPKGLQAVRQRVARVGSACLSMIFGLMSVAYAQKSDPLVSTDIAIPGEVVANPQPVPGIYVTVTDRNGAVIPGARTVLYLSSGDAKNRDQKIVRRMDTGNEGSLSFLNVNPGVYKLEVSSPYFKKTVVDEIVLRAGDARRLTVEMEVAGESVEVGIFTDSEPLIDMGSSGITTTIKGRKLIVW